MKAHPAADLFPMMSEEDLAGLTEDIRANGQIHDIVIHDGSILDGRNRWRACEAAGIEPKTRQWNGEGGSPTRYAWAVNGVRRHLSASAKAMAGVKLLPLLEQEAAARRERTQGRPKETERNIALSFQEQPRRAADDAADLVGVSPRYVQEAKAIAASDPELAERVARDEITIPQAKREIKERAREERRAENAAKIAETSAARVETVEGRFATIVADPPWSWSDEGDQDQLGRARPQYETMSIAELHDLEPWGRPVDDLADVDAHIYLWITNRSLPKGFALLEAWGFRYVTMLTWVKPSFGMGNYFRGQTEHVLFGVKGSQQLKRKDVGTVFHAKRGPGGHSSKPTEFHDLVESCSPGPYLELFSRVDRDGWTAWGESC